MLCHETQRTSQRFLLCCCSRSIQSYTRESLSAIFSYRSPKKIPWNDIVLFNPIPVLSFSRYNFHRIFRSTLEDYDFKRRWDIMMLLGTKQGNLSTINVHQTRGNVLRIVIRVMEYQWHLIWSIWKAISTFTFHRLDRGLPREMCFWSWSLRF